MGSRRFQLGKVFAMMAGGVALACSSAGAPEPAEPAESVGTRSEALVAAAPTNLCEFTVYSRQQSTFQDRSTSSTGFVGSATAVTLGNDSHVTGDVRSTGTVLMNDRSRVDGNVTAGGLVTRRNQTGVSGTVAQNTPVPALTIPTKTVTFGTADVNVANGVTRVLAPGNYQDVHPFGGSTLNLRSGTYNIRSFLIESSSVNINLDVTNGPIDINVQNELRFGDGMRMSLVGGTNPRQVRYYTNWPNQLNIGNDLTLFGVVTAPNAQIVGFSRTIVKGSLFGRTVTLGPDNNIAGACQCGNGFLDPNEQCDDGNTNNNDGCTNSCRVAACGDGIVQTGVEECDDGNTNDLDSCSNPGLCDLCTTPTNCQQVQCGCQFRPLRKNVSFISQAERTALISAMRELDRRFYAQDGVSFWDKQDQIHEFTHVHGSPNFLSWHRELLNRYERLLRKVDPTVALHYWDWHVDPLTADASTGRAILLGPSNPNAPPLTFGLGVGPNGEEVRAGFPFDIMDANGAPPPASRPSDSEPGTDFRLPVQLITRQVNCPASQFRPDATLVGFSDWSTPDGTGFSDEIQNEHASVHVSCIGGTVVDAHHAFEDPFVFMFHSNIDRIWALWQTMAGHAERLNPATVYGPQTNDPTIIEPLQPWAGQPNFCPGFLESPPAPPCPLSPWDPTQPPSSDPDERVVNKNSRHPSVVRPPRYDTNGTL